MKSFLKDCRNAEQVLAEVRRISETCVTIKPNCKLRYMPLLIPRKREIKVFRPWDGGRNWEVLKPKNARQKSSGIGTP